MNLSTAGTDDLPIVRIEGELDARGALAFQKAVRRIMRGKVVYAIIDLRDCTYIDSAGLGMLFSLTSWAREGGGNVAAVGPRVRVLHVMRLVRLTDERSFHIFADLASAEAFLSSERSNMVHPRNDASSSNQRTTSSFGRAVIRCALSQRVVDGDPEGQSDATCKGLVQAD